MKKSKAEKEREYDEFLEKIKREKVRFIGGESSLYDLVFSVGVKRKLEYYNRVEVMLPKKERSVLAGTTELKDVTWDLGLEFNNGVTIRGVDRAVFKLATDCENLRIRERNPDYTPPKGTHNTEAKKELFCI